MFLNFLDDGMNRKKSQITIFMIVGFVILLVLIAILFMTSRNLRVDEDVLIPEELFPAKNFIDNCMHIASEDALFFLGRQGGFINVPQEIRNTPDRRMQFGLGTEILPFWYFDNRNYIPSYEFMENELSEYISENFVECIRGLGLPKYGFFLTTFVEEATSIVKITDDSVAVEIVFPMLISSMSENVEVRVSRFYHNYNVRLRDMMELAIYILDYQNQFAFFEDLTLRLMTMNPNIPFSNMEFDCSVKTWHIDNIKREVQDMLFDTIDQFRLEGTDYFPYLADEEIYQKYREYSQALVEAYNEVPLVGNFENPNDYENALNRAVLQRTQQPDEPLPPDAFYYFNFRMPLEKTSSERARYETFNVDALYDFNYGLNIQAKPSNNGVLKSNTLRGASRFLSFMCMNLYSFAYDITYPLIININDPEAFGRRGFSFRFAFPVLIRNNEGVRSLQYMSSFRSLPELDTFCHDGTGERAIVRVYDKSEGSLHSIKDADVSMVCLNRRCELGKTYAVGIDNLLRINMSTSCSNPIFVAEKEGYLQGSVQVEDDAQVISVEMVKLKNISAEFHSARFDFSTNRTYSSLPVNAGSVALYITGDIDGQLYEKAYELRIQDQNYIELPKYDADYDITLIYLRDGENFAGSFNLENYRITRNQVENSDKVIFTFTEVPMSTFQEDIANIMDVLERAQTSSKIEFK